MKDEKLWGYLAAKASHQVSIELLLTFVTSGRKQKGMAFYGQPIVKSYVFLLPRASFDDVAFHLRFGFL